ncbi:mCG19183, isoform CRA_c [Mus musculus]|nr:mCG19183, isoform CRA_c [Mus musculus]
MPSTQTKIIYDLRKKESSYHLYYCKYTNKIMYGVSGLKCIPS